MTEVAGSGSYEQRIAALDAANSAELINNSSTAHAIPLIARLFARGRQTIRVFSGSLDPGIYAKPPIIEALGVFLVGRGGNLNILIEKSRDVVPDDALLGPSGMLAALCDRFGPSVLDNVKVRRANVAREGLSHFLVVDGEGFRLEPDSSKHEAVAAFNLPEFANRLHEAFDALFARGEEVDLSFIDSAFAAA